MNSDISVHNNSDVTVQNIFLLKKTTSLKVVHKFSKLSPNAKMIKNSKSMAKVQKLINNIINKETIKVSFLGKRMA